MFLVGKGKSPLKIHIDVVKRLSDPLYAMMTNGMQESVDRVIQGHTARPLSHKSGREAHAFDCSHGFHRERILSTGSERFHRPGGVSKEIIC